MSAVVGRAPGKLFITGEYAVMQPGSPAVLIAVNRLVTVRATPADGVRVTSDLYPAPVALRWDGTRLTGRTPDDDREAHERFTPVLAACEVVADLLSERGLPIPGVMLDIRSELHDSGTKFGLGSSGAVTVAVVAAMLGSAGVHATAGERYRLAMIATARTDPRASGADLAAAVWWGWIAYAAPDRDAMLRLVAGAGVAATLGAPWPGLMVRRLSAPERLRLEVGWTGHPASTGDLIGGGRSRGNVGWRDTSDRRKFITDMTHCAAATIGAIDRGDVDGVLHHIRAARALLSDLDEVTGLGIFTDRLTALCECAEAFGAAGKPSGAGGGDCGIALLDTAADTDLAGLHRCWTAAGVRPLPLEVLEPDSRDRR